MVLLAEQTTVTEGQALLLATAGSAIPIALWLVFFYTRDRYEREPKRLIALLFLVGAIPAAMLAGVANATAGLVVGGLVAAVLVAPVGEEILKYLGVRLTASRHRAFNEPIDGMIYGSTVGLGFAFTENIDYLFAGVLGIPMAGDEVLCEPGVECFMELAFLRGTGTALMHALATGIAGFFLAKRLLANRPAGVEWKGLGFAMLVHAAWNLGLVFPAIAGAAAGYAVLARRALAASPHRLASLDDSHHWIEHFAVGDGLLQPCPRCQRLHHPGQRYCSVCGFQVLAARTPHSVPCPACAHPQPVTSRFCTACGTALRDLSGTRAAPAGASEPVDDRGS